MAAAYVARRRHVRVAAASVASTAGNTTSALAPRSHQRYIARRACAAARCRAIPPRRTYNSA